VFVYLLTQIDVYRTLSSSLHFTGLGLWKARCFCGEYPPHKTYGKLLLRWRIYGSND